MRSLSAEDLIAAFLAGADVVQHPELNQTRQKLAEAWIRNRYPPGHEPKHPVRVLVFTATASGKWPLGEFDLVERQTFDLSNANGQLMTGRYVQGPNGATELHIVLSGLEPFAVEKK